MKSFNGDTHYGADIVRLAFKIAESRGLNGNPVTAQKNQDAFVQIANSLHVSILELAQKYNILEWTVMTIGGEKSFVPKDHQAWIMYQIGAVGLNSPTPEITMASLGYSLRKIEGIPFYTPDRVRIDKRSITYQSFMKH